MKRKSYPIKSKRMNHIHLVPYSEHSSYKELREYVRFLKPHKVSSIFWTWHSRILSLPPGKCLSEHLQPDP